MKSTRPTTGKLRFYGMTTLKMRALSVSDIIVMHEDGQAHAYYVEPIGYKQVDDLLPGLEQTKKRSVAREER